MKWFHVDPADLPRWGELPTAAQIRRESFYDQAPELFAGATVPLQRTGQKLHLPTCHSLSGVTAFAVTVGFHELLEDYLTGRGAQPLCDTCCGFIYLIDHVRASVPGVRELVMTMYASHLVDLGAKGVRARSATSRVNAANHLADAGAIVEQLVNSVLPRPVETLVEALQARYQTTAQRLAGAAADNAAADRVQFEQWLRRRLRAGNSRLDETPVLVGVPRFALSDNGNTRAARVTYKVASDEHADILRCPLWVWSFLARHQRPIRRGADCSVMILGDDHRWLEQPGAYETVLAVYSPAGDSDTLATIGDAVEAARLLLGAAQAS